MEQQELIKLIKSLRDKDITKKFENEIAVLEHEFETANGNELLLEQLYLSYNQLAKKITGELEAMKED